MFWGKRLTLSRLPLACSFCMPVFRVAQPTDGSQRRLPHGMKFTIVTPVLNGARFLRETVESVLSQCGDFELEYIVRDGGSTDGTLEILREYGDRLRVVSAKDGGPAAATNAGMAEATGDIVAWLSADDVYEAGALQKVAELFRRHPQVEWCYGRCGIMNENGREIRRAVTWYKNLIGWAYSRNMLLCENYINQPATFWRRELWRKCGGLSTQYKAAFDYDLWLRMAQIGRPAHLRARLARFRRHAGSISENLLVRQFAEEAGIAAAHGNALHRFLHELNRRKIVWVYRLLSRMEQSRRGAIEPETPGFAVCNPAVSASVIIVSYNGRHLLQDCLDGLRAQTRRDFEVILVDNGSSDGSLAAAARLYPGIRVISLNHNTGFAYANNVGIRAAVGRHIVLLNNDTRAEPHFLEQLISVAESDNSVGMIAPKILNFFNRQEIDSVGGLVLTRDFIGQGRGRGELDRGQYDGLRSVLLPSGCAALYKREMLHQTGLFDVSFFAYCEDTDLGLRGLRAGWRTLSAPMSVVYHKYSATTGGGHSSQKLFLVERNHLVVAMRHMACWFLPLLPLFWAWRFLLMGYCYVFSRGGAKRLQAGVGVGAYAGALLRAYGSVAIRLFHILRERRACWRGSDSHLRSALRDNWVSIAKMTMNS